MRHLLPGGRRYLETADAHHFSFLPPCGDGAIEWLAASGEPFVCQELGARTRAQIHPETLQAIADFLAAHGVL